MKSEIKHVGYIKFPEFSATRWMMMPIRLEDVHTVPNGYREFTAFLLEFSTVKSGVAYLTVDEVGAYIVLHALHRRRPSGEDELAEGLLPTRFLWRAGRRKS